jgi:hypothetical protein
MRGWDISEEISGEITDWIQLPQDMILWLSYILYTGIAAKEPG